MKILNINNYEVLLDDQDYNEISNMTGWYIQKEEFNNSRTNYVVHDKYGRLHRSLLKITDSKIIVDHIDRNGLNCQRRNLRITTCSENKRNSEVLPNNKFHFNGLSFEKAKGNRKWRIKVSYQTNERLTENKFKQKTKSFGPSSGKDFNTLIKEAILFRLSKMREFGYIIDERSETIEKECLKESSNMEEVLNISFKDFEVE